MQEWKEYIYLPSQRLQNSRLRGYVEKKVSHNETLAILLWGKNKELSQWQGGPTLNRVVRKVLSEEIIVPEDKICLLLSIQVKVSYLGVVLREKMTSSPPILPLSLWRKEVGTVKLPPLGNLILNDLSLIQR